MCVMVPLLDRFSVSSLEFLSPLPQGQRTLANRISHLLSSALDTQCEVLGAMLSLAVLT
jgi:hypothetical protein